MVKILDCTLRDGGYITDWYFDTCSMKKIVNSLTESGVDYIECGYINPNATEKDKAVFSDIEQISELIPDNRGNTVYLAMADCAQILAGEITPHSGRSIDGIRVVFYKHQIQEAMELCRSVRENGYLLLVQPMVTIDYSFTEYAALIREIEKLSPYAVSIVDSFGYMNKQDFRRYFAMLDGSLDNDTIVGFHSHNNMQLAFVTAQDVLDYETERERIIDASLLGIGRGAGNLNLELIANYCNLIYGERYDVSTILSTAGSEIMPIREKREWGYSPYLFLTGKYRCHPNFACFLLENHDVTVKEFEEFVRFIPDEMRTKCRRPYVEELYQKFIG